MNVANVTVKVEHIVRLDDLASLACRIEAVRDVERWDPAVFRVYCCVDGCGWVEGPTTDDSLFRVVKLAVEHTVEAHP